MNKRVKISLALFLALAVLFQYSFSPQALFAYGLNNTDKAVQTEETATDGGQPADKQEATDPADEPAAEPTEPSTEPAAEPTKPAAEDEQKDEDTEEVKYPAQTFSESAGGVSVAVSAPEGALPEGATMKVEAVKSSEVDKAVEELIDNGTVVKAVDITFYDKEGKEIEPNKNVSVNMTSAAFKGLDAPAVVHIKDNGDAEKVDNGTVTGSKATFRSDDFSIYVVVENENPDPDARLEVNFYEADGTTLIRTMSLTKNQLDAGQMNVNIYDPGVEGLGDGEVFKGWTEKKNYTVRDAENGLTIADIRGKVRTLLNTGSVQEGDKINLYAMVFESYHISYLDELAVTIYTDEVLYKAGDTEVPYTVQFAYTPYYVTGSDESDETKAANFDGWKQMDPETATPAPVYDNGETINMADKGLTTEKNTLVLMAQVAYGHWLVFNENASGASYTPPLFVGTDQTPAQAGMPDPPSRQGYTFDGWYMNDECTTPFVPSQQITETTTVYAKWNVNTETSFSVLIWEESLGDGTSYEGKKYNFVRSIEIDNARTGIRMDSVVRGNVGDSTIKVNGEDVFIPLLSVKPTDPDYGKACKGFTYRGNSGNNQGIVVANGTSVLNVYFDRREYTLKFYYGAQVGTGNNSWRVAHNNSTSEYTWSQPSGFTPGYTAGTLATGSDNTGDGKVSGATYHYAAIKAKYGEEIGDKWPEYGDFNEGINQNPRDQNNLNSWILMPGAKARTGQYGGDITVKGKITIMDEQVLGNLTSENGNYLVAQYNTTAYDYTYSIYFRDAQGTRQYNGNRYSLHESIKLRSGSEYNKQHEPSYRGYSYVGREDHPAGTTGRTIYFYYEPIKYPILFKDGLYVDGSGNTIKNNNTNELYSLQDDDAITYKQSVAEYNKFDPTELIGPDGKKYVFLGWYSDDTCSEKYTFTTMPEGGITVYAKWVLKEYKVTLHPNENGDSSFKYRNGNPAGHYGPYGDVIYVDNGEKIGDVGGTRDLYDLIGWFTNENRSRVWDFSAFEMNDEMVLKYDGDIYATDGSDPRYNPQYPGTIGEIDLYTSWRRILDGADGINITYTTIGLNDKGETVEGTGAPTDINEYSDQAQAIARPACQPPEAGQGEVQQAFQYWVVQRWDKTTGAYVDTDQHVYPGDRYWVNFDDAKEEDWVDPENPKKTKKYTVQLRAQYGAAEYAPPTHIYWYDNYTDSEDGIIHRDEPLDINQAVDVQPAPSSREGYDFIGWGKESEVKSDGTPIYTYDLGEDDLFLVYDSDSGTYTYTPSGTTESKPAEQVFADETKPYDGLYAVWREQTVKIEYKVASDSTGRGTVSLPEEEVPVITGEPAGSTATASSTDYVLGYWTCDDGTEHISSAAHFTPSKNDDGFYEAHTYYAHFVEAKATVTVEHYLKGETTPFDTDVVENLDIGSTYTATPKTALQGKTLTVDSKDPESGSITVSASNNLIKIYYTLPLTITAKDKTYTYNGEAQGPAGTYTSGFDTYVTVEGLLSDDALTSITLSGKETNQGTYTDEIVPSDAAVGNKSYYVVTYVDADLTIKKAELTITAKPLIYTYNGEAQGPAGTYTSGFDTYVIVSGLQGSDKLTSITLSGKKTNQGTYTNEIEPSDAAVGENTDNYDIKYVKADLTINKAVLTITAIAQTYTYNGEAQGPAGTHTSGFDTYVTVSGLKGSDKLTSITLSGSKTNAGEYKNEIEPSAAAVGENTGNYEINYVKADLTIDAATLTITAIAKTYTYNGGAQGPAGTYTSGFDTYVTVSGLQGSDALTSITMSGKQTDARVYPNEIVPRSPAVPARLRGTCLRQR